MKKIIGFVGSPRKNGNTSELVKATLKGAEDNGAETKIYYLNEMEIKGCQSCHYCRGHETCSIKDDMQAVYEDIKTADGLVIGSPVYMWQVSGQTKLLLDRFFPLTNNAHQPRFGEKKVVMVYSQAAPVPEIFKQYFDYNEKMVQPLGFRVVDTIVATKAIAPGSVTKDQELMNKAFQAGKLL